MDSVEFWTQVEEALMESHVISGVRREQQSITSYDYCNSCDARVFKTRLGSWRHYPNQKSDDRKVFFSNRLIIKPYQE
jgi:hypothetical protein